MRKKRGLFFLILIVFFLAGGSFHHHADGHFHKDCLVCSLQIQNGAYLSPLVTALNSPFASLSLFSLRHPLYFFSDPTGVFSVRAPPALPFSLA